MTFGVSCPTTWMRILRDRSVPPSPRIADGKAVLIGRDMPASSPELAAAFAEGVTAPGPDVVDSGLLDRHAVLRRRRASTLPRRCSPPPTTRPSTTASSCACAGARPVGEDTGSADDQGDGRGRCRARPRARPGDVRAAATCSQAYADHVRSLRRRRGAAAAEGRRRHRQRHGRARRPGGVRAAARSTLECHVRRARRHVPEPSRRPDPAREPARPAGRVVLERAPTSGWPSTATPTGCSSSTSRREAVAARPPRRCVAAGDAASASRARRSCTT